uniref:Putative secreted protein n=1 Tax=Amblyomma triste TaxID=251400 RepID=A0A023G4B2_AMBTT
MQTLKCLSVFTKACVQLTLECVTAAEGHPYLCSLWMSSQTSVNTLCHLNISNLHISLLPYAVLITSKCPSRGFPQFNAEPHCVALHKYSLHSFLNAVMKHGYMLKQILSLCPPEAN